MSFQAEVPAVLQLQCSSEAQRGAAPPAAAGPEPPLERPAQPTAAPSPGTALSGGFQELQTLNITEKTLRFTVLAF